MLPVARQIVWGRASRRSLRRSAEPIGQDGDLGGGVVALEQLGQGLGRRGAAGAADQQTLRWLEQGAGPPESLSSSPLAAALMPGLLAGSAPLRCTRPLLLPLISAPTLI